MIKLKVSLMIVRNLVKKKKKNRKLIPNKNADFSEELPIK